MYIQHCLLTSVITWAAGFNADPLFRDQRGVHVLAHPLVGGVEVTPRHDEHHVQAFSVSERKVLRHNHTILDVT